MSCNNWESGTIVIPRAAWPKFKTDLRAAYNALQDQKLALAERWYTELLVRSKGQRNFDWREGLNTIIQEEAQRRRHHDTSDDTSYDVSYILVPYTREKKLGSAGKPKMPKKQDYAPANGATLAFEFGEARIRLDNEKHTVHWSTGENNRAVDRAHEHPMGVAFFRALGAITWVRNSGGELVGNDEYNRDTENPGGGGNYVTRTYGPESKAEARARQAATAYGRYSGSLGGGRRW